MAIEQTRSLQSHYRDSARDFMELSCNIHANGYDQKLLRESVASILEANQLCSMATCTATGNDASPYINTVYFVYTNELKIYFLSQPTRQHSLNLARTPAISLTIFDSSQSWGSHLQGLQIFGECSRTEGQEGRSAFDLYTKRFPKLLDLVPCFEDYERGIIQSRFYEIATHSIKIFDEPRFGKDVWVNAVIASERKILEGLTSEV